MTCPQCSADLPDSATFCLKCGSNIRPVAFSYLPAGVPSWPTTIPEQSFYGHRSTDQAMQEGEHVSAAKLTPKPRRSALSILGIVALLILTPLVGVGVTLGSLWMNGEFPVNASQASVHAPPLVQRTPAATSTPTTGTQGNQLPTPTSFQTATSSVVGITLKYPSNWIADAPQTTADSSALGFHPQQQIGIFFSIERFTATASSKITSTGQVNQGNLAQFQGAQGISNFQVMPATTPQRTIGGAHWDEQDASFANTNNVTFHLTSIAVQRNHFYYDIIFYSPQVYYDEAVQKYFQPMFDSFQFQ